MRNRREEEEAGGGCRMEECEFSNKKWKAMSYTFTPQEGTRNKIMSTPEAHASKRHIG